MKNKIADNRKKIDIRKGMKRISVALALAMVFTLAEPAVAEPGTGLAVGRQAGTGAVAGLKQVEAASEASADYQAALKKTSAVIEKTLTAYKVEEEDPQDPMKTVQVSWYGPANASIGGEWAVIGETRYGRENPMWYRAYYENLMRVLHAAGDAAQTAEAGKTTPLKLHNTKSTENSRAILALTSMGIDASDVEGYDLTAVLSDLTYLKKQGLNGPIWALIALDSGHYTIPQTTGNAGSQADRESILSYILSRELAKGGYNLTRNASQGADPDITAMALQAFAPYYTGRIAVGAELKAQIQESVDRSLKILSDLQKSSGAYSSYGSENAESTAQVLVALSSLGIDAEKDSRFIKNGKSVIDGLMHFYIASDGMFHHVDTEAAGNQMATEQAFYALVSYDRYKNKKNTLYDMSDAEKVCVMALADCQIKVSKTSYTYTGKAVTPSVSITCKKLDGTTLTLKKGEDYTVTYTDNKLPGKASVLVKGRNQYTGAVSKTITIAPEAVTLSSTKNVETGIRLGWRKTTGAEKYIIYRKAGNGAWKKYKSVKASDGCSFTDTKVKNGSKYAYKLRAYADGIYGAYSSTYTVYRIKQPTLKVKKTGKGRLQCTWKKNAKAGSYQIMYGTKASLKGAKTITIKKAGTVKKTITGLNAGKKYYIRIRSCKTVNKKKYYSSWSKTVNIRA